MLKPIILDDFSWQKLEIMAYLSQQPPGTYSINTLSNALGLSYTAGSTLVQEIHADLSELFSMPFLNDFGKIQWQSQGYRHNEYIQYLLRGSVIYSFVIETLLHPETSFQDFCQKFFLSQSTVLRKLRPLKEYLQKFQLKLMPSKMKITGRETLLRMFYTVYLWAGDHGTMLLNSFDYSFVTEKQLIQQLGWDSKDFMHPQEIFLRLAVNRIRGQQGHFLPDLPLDASCFSDFIQPLETYASSFIPDGQQARCHARFIGYMLYFTPYYLDIDDFRVQELNHYYENLKESQLPIALLAEEYEAFLFSQLIDSEKAQYEESFLLHINVFVTLMNYLVHGGDAPMIMDIARTVTTTDGGLFDDIHSYNQQFFRKIVRRKDFTWLAPALEDLVTDLAYVVIPTYKESLTHDFLNVAILTTPDYWVSQTVKELLKQFAFIKIHYGASDHQEIDFFVTTFECLLPKDLAKPYYVVELVPGSDYQTELFVHLWQAYKAKLIKRQTQPESRSHIS